VSGEVSVIVPTLNEEARIERCLKSVAAQAAHVGEVLVVDCGSTDGTVEAVEALRDGLPVRIELLHSEEKSYAAAVSTGVLKARCRYVQLVDGDSVLSEGWLEKGLGLLRSGGCDVTHGWFVFVNNSLYGDLRNSGKSPRTSAGGPALLRAAAIRECNYDPDLKRSSDVDVYIRLKAQGYRICPLDEPMLVKDDTDNPVLNLEKVLKQGYYAGKMLAKNSGSRRYVDLFVKLRRPYLLHTSFLLLASLGPFFLPRRLLVPMLPLPLVLRVLKRRGRVRESLLWSCDRLLRSGAFALGLATSPGSLPRVAAGLLRAAASVAQ
jgi:glycosyltransferase involved in cell wall biosynthesis